VRDGDSGERGRLSFGDARVGRLRLRERLLLVEVMKAFSALAEAIRPR